MNLNNQQLLILGLSSAFLFGIGFYNKTYIQEPKSVFAKIEDKYTIIDLQSKPFDIVLIYDPKEKEINLFYDQEHLGYGEKVGSLTHLKPLTSYLYKLSNQRISKINLYIKNQQINLFLQEIPYPKIIKKQIKYSRKLTLVETLAFTLKKL